MSRVLAFDVPPGKPVLRGNDHYWRVILEVGAGGASWSVTDVLSRSRGADRSSINDFVRRLCRAGFVVEAADRQRHYRLIRSQLTTPSLRRDGTPGLQGRGQTAMWNVLRGPLGRSGISAPEVALYASTETVRVAPASAASYLKHLAQAGYLLCLREGKPGKPASYRLKPAMQTGPLPPLVLRTQIVFDQNRGEAVGPVEAREVEP